MSSKIVGEKQENKILLSGKKCEHLYNLLLYCSLEVFLQRGACFLQHYEITIEYIQIHYKLANYSLK